jgi:hypothetical protein
MEKKKRGNPNITKVSKPFQKGNDDRRNVNGQPRNTISKALKEFGQYDKLEGEFTLTKYDDKGNETDKLVKKFHIENKKDHSVNDLIATMLLQKAMGGDLKAVQIILERTEGAPKQEIAHEVTNMPVVLDFTTSIEDEAANETDVSE